MVALTVSCSKNNDDDGGQQNTGADIAGIWTGTAVNYTGSTETETGGISISADFVGTGFDIDYTITFGKNPNLATTSGSYSIELVTTVLGQSTTQNVTGINFNNTGDWSRNGTELTIENNGVPSTATILELTETTLVINIVETQSQTINGATVTTTVDSDFSFTR